MCEPCHSKDAIEEQGSPDSILAELSVGDRSLDGHAGSTGSTSCRQSLQRFCPSNGSFFDRRPSLTQVTGWIFSIKRSKTINPNSRTPEQVSACHTAVEMGVKQDRSLACAFGDGFAGAGPHSSHCIIPYRSLGPNALMFLVRSVTAVSTWGRLRFRVEKRWKQQARSGQPFTRSGTAPLGGPGRSKGRYEEEGKEAVVASGGGGGGGAPLWEDRTTRPSP